jgi:precorrin-6A/cobalt-precorrin-6A reductase
MCWLSRAVEKLLAVRADCVLVLGGTREARELAVALAATGFEVIYSLAGVTENPAVPAGRIRLGGFGGVEGLFQFLVEEGVVAIADATHPFAAQISHHAAAAAGIANVPYLRLERMAWSAAPGDRWISAANAADAAQLLASGSRAFVTVGRKEIGRFFAVPGVTGVARMIEPPGIPVPPHWDLILARPPFTYDSERSLLKRHAITHVVAKNAGGNDGLAKIVAARDAGLPVVMIERPLKPEAPTYSTDGNLVAALRRSLSP